MQPLEEGWQYRWGDSPLSADGTPQWILEEDSDQWQAIAFPSNPPDRRGREHAWFRVTLPEGEWFAPVLYIYSVDIIVQAWFQGELLYQYGTFDDQGRGRFEGWPWHQIPLPENYEGETLYFRVFSNYTDIGLWGEVAILDYSDLVLHIVSGSTKSLVIAVVSALIALLALIFGLLQRGQKSFFSIALFALATAVMLVAESQASLLIGYTPLLWDYLAAGSYYLIPVALALLLQQWLSELRPVLAGWIWKLHLAFAIVALALSLMGPVDLSSTFPVFDGLLLVSLLLLAVSAGRRFRRLYREQQILLVTFTLFSGFLIADMAVAHGFLPWARVPVSWGALAFSLAVISISVWHYGKTQKALQELTVRLEQKVAERTERAEALAQREVARSRLLALESSKSQKLAGVIASIQDCFTLDQAFDMLLAAIPALYLPMDGCFYRRTTAGHYERVLSWGHISDQVFPMMLEGDVSDLKPTTMPVSHQSLPEQLCFFLRVEPDQTGNRPSGVLLLSRPELPEALVEYGTARIVAWVFQSIEKMGITLSGLVLREQLQRFSYEDGLTGLKNRRHFDEFFRHEREVSLRTGSPLSILMIDIDHFKSFNDDFGHQAGDEALKMVGDMLGQYFRGSDTVCRYGGEEFAVLMPGAPLEEARLRAEALRNAIEKTLMSHEGQALGTLTISAGIACWPESCSDFDGLFREADKALYRAKNTGRNRVVAASS
ncbi:MAG: Response regulator containing a CheY-like receiver domain and a GGDEF domain [Marinobacter excellens HL-55]|uniref:diguanylate cyclase n=1 Tax=Marinobacter excellens HL-55 TaxID=1305731 RepID=A0A0N8KLC1_9GAMM|nr:MAG: Response regulator containing a CheY-like receiver domain and a GGDEF domain [Marinobacter excellens HL-55]